MKVAAVPVPPSAFVFFVFNNLGRFFSVSVGAGGKNCDQVMPMIAKLKMEVCDGRSGQVRRKLGVTLRTSEIRRPQICDWCCCESAV